MFEYIVNKLTANFIVYELAEFTSLKSTYSKTNVSNFGTMEMIRRKRV